MMAIAATQGLAWLGNPSRDEADGNGKPRLKLLSGTFRDCAIDEVNSEAGADD